MLTIVEAFQQTKDTLNNEDSFNALGMLTSDDMAPVPKLKVQHFLAISPILSEAKNLNRDQPRPFTTFRVTPGRCALS